MEKLKNGSKISSFQAAEYEYDLINGEECKCEAFLHRFECFELSNALYVLTCMWLFTLHEKRCEGNIWMIVGVNGEENM